MSKGVALILGARSDIGMATAHRFARAGYDIQLAARNSDSLSANKSDIELRYKVIVTLHEFDALNISSHEAFVCSLPELPTVVICAIGYMGDQSRSELNIEEAALVMRSNYEGPASILAVLANSFEERGSGVLVGISSVAGVRGRATNYVYGSAKAGFTEFLSGLRNRLFRRGVHVVTVLPGYVNTKMISGFNVNKKLVSEASAAAEAIFYSVKNQENIKYVGSIWRLITCILALIPESIFKKTKI